MCTAQWTQRVHRRARSVRLSVRPDGRRAASSYAERVSCGDMEWQAVSRVCAELGAQGGFWAICGTHDVVRPGSSTRRSRSGTAHRCVIACLSAVKTVAFPCVREAAAKSTFFRDLSRGQRIAHVRSVARGECGLLSDEGLLLGVVPRGH